MPDYPFTEVEMQAAFNEWGCNCGPSALAFALQIPLHKVRGQIPHFEERRYTNPTMMRCALANLGRKYFNAVAERENMFRETALVRLQWTGPWTKPGAPARWAYRQTHWITCWRDTVTSRQLVFDCNGGIRSFPSWEKEIVPILTALYKRADGGWFPTHIWRVYAA